MDTGCPCSTAHNSYCSCSHIIQTALLWCNLLAANSWSTGSGGTWPNNRVLHCVSLWKLPWPFCMAAGGQAACSHGQPTENAPGCHLQSGWHNHEGHWLVYLLPIQRFVKLAPLAAICVVCCGGLVLFGVDSLASHNSKARRVRLFGCAPYPAGASQDPSLHPCSADISNSLDIGGTGEGKEAALLFR